jgi:Tfp pilus assembly protein PilO
MNNSFLIPTFLIALSAALTWIFTVPSWKNPTGAFEFSAKSVAELRADEQVYQDAFDKMREIELARSGLAAKYNAVKEEDRTRLEKFLPAHADSVRIVLDLENMARTHGLKLRNVSVTPPVDKIGARASEENYQLLTASISAIGDYEKFVPFLADLEESIRLSDITGVSFESKDAKEYVYGITLRTYQLSPESPEEEKIE